MPRCCRAVRTVSALTRARVSPRSPQTSATKASVQVDRALPKPRGEVCRSSRSLSALAASNRGSVVCGREDFCCKHPTPSRAKARSPLRTVWSPQLKCWAIWRGVWPTALASKIWLRRRVKASARTPSGVERRAFFFSQRTDKERSWHGVDERTPALSQ